MYANRRQAGEELARALAEYRGRPGVVILALPRGGVVIGRAVADALGVPLDIAVPRKIGFPGNEEYAIGAITETGEAVWNEAQRARITDEYAAQATRREQAEALRRLNIYRAGRPQRDLNNKVVIVVDDGIATGYTMRAAINSIRVEQPKKLIVAVPVAPRDTVEYLKDEADEVVALRQPIFFGAIGAHYRDFNQVSDEEVIKLLDRVKKPRWLDGVK